MRRHLIALGYGLGGITLAFALTFGALAIAVPEVGNPTSPIVFDLTTTVSPSPAESPEPDKGGGKDGAKDGAKDGGKESPAPEATGSPTASPSVDDHGGDSPAPDGSDDGSGPDGDADD